MPQRKDESQWFTEMGESFSEFIIETFSSQEKTFSSQNKIEYTKFWKTFSLVGLKFYIYVE